MKRSDVEIKRSKQMNTMLKWKGDAYRVSHQRHTSCIVMTLQLHIKFLLYENHYQY